MARQHAILLLPLLVAGCLAWWLAAERRHALAVRPPAGVTRLTPFLEARPQWSQIRRFSHLGKTYVVLIGIASPSFPALPSGPPAYVFDTTGRLVDWCGDSGDDPSFATRWGGFAEATPLSAPEARELVSPPGR